MSEATFLEKRLKGVSKGVISVMAMESLNQGGWNDSTLEVTEETKNPNMSWGTRVS